MAETLRLFISATSDLEAERDLIGTTLAQLPAHNRVENPTHSGQGRHLHQHF